MSTEQYDPELADQMRQQIRVLVREIENLARSELSPTEFYEAFLTRVVAAMAAEGGAIWMSGEGGRLELAYQINLRVTQLADNREAQEQHGRLIRKALTTGQGLIAAPHSGTVEDAANPTEYLLVLGPLKNENETQGVVEIIQRPGALPNVERGYLRFILQMCDFGGDYLKTHRLRQFTSRQAMWTQLEQFTRLVHRDLKPRETAYTIANEGRRLIECDRVSVAVKRGSQFRLEAISGQEGFDRRANLVTLLNQLITTVCRSGEPLWYTGDTTNLPPQVEEAVEAYVDEAHTKLLAILPLSRPRDEAVTAQLPPGQVKPQEVLGALVVEQITEDALSNVTQRRVEVVRDHSALALANAIEHQSLFLLPVWRFLGKSRAVVAWRNLPKTLAVLTLVIGTVLALFLIPADFKLKGRGVLDPIEKRDIFAEVTGTVVNVEPQAEQGKHVNQGDLLAELISPELEAQISATRGEIVTQQRIVESIASSISSSAVLEADKIKLRGERAKALSAINSLREKEAILLEQLKKLAVVSPITGVMTSWQVRDKLINRPVQRGEKMMTVANPDGEWELVLQMPEDKMGHILKARRELKKQLQEKQQEGDLTVTFILATHPSIEHTGWIKEIHTIAETQGEEGNMVQIKVAIDKRKLVDAGINEQDFRPGAGVTALVNCGKTRLGYAWFHDVIAFVQSRVLFRFL